MASSAHVLLRVAESHDNVATVANWLALHVYPAVPQWWTKAPAEMCAALALRFRVELLTATNDSKPYFTLFDLTTWKYYAGIHMVISREDKFHALLEPTAIVEYIIAQCGVMMEHINSIDHINKENISVARDFARIVNRMLSVFACMIHGRPVILTFHEDCTSELAVTFAADTSGMPTLSLNTAHLVPRTQGYRVGNVVTPSLLEYIILLICYTNELTRPPVEAHDYNPHAIDITSVYNAQQFKQRLDALVARMRNLLVVPLEEYSKLDCRVTVTRTSDNMVTVTKARTGETWPVMVSAGCDTLLDRFSIIAGISALLRHTDSFTPTQVATMVFREIFGYVADIFPGMAMARRVIIDQIHDIDVEESDPKRPGMEAFVAPWYNDDGSFAQLFKFRLYLGWLRRGQRQLHSSVGVPPTPDLAIAETLWHEAVHMCAPPRRRGEDAHGDQFHAFVERQGVHMIWRSATSCRVSATFSYPGIAYYTTARASAM
jgi:hypothetical protein